MRECSEFERLSLEGEGHDDELLFSVKHEERFLFTL